MLTYQYTSKNGQLKTVTGNTASEAYKKATPDMGQGAFKLVNSANSQPVSSPQRSVSVPTKPSQAVPTYGSQVTDSMGRVGTAKFDPNTGKPLKAPSNSNGGDPFGVSNDPNLMRLYNIFQQYPELKNMADSQTQLLIKNIESGKVVNPNIALTPQDNQKLYDAASTYGDPAYKEQIGFAQKDLSNSLTNLSQDYNTFVTRQQQNYGETQKTQAESEAGSGTAFSSGRQKRQLQLQTNQQNALDDAYTQTQRTGQSLGTQAERAIGSDAVRQANNPWVTPYSATGDSINPSGRGFYVAPIQGNVVGTLPKAREVAVQNRKSQLESAFRLSRNLNLQSLQ